MLPPSLRQEATESFDDLVLDAPSHIESRAEVAGERSHNETLARNIASSQTVGHNT